MYRKVSYLIVDEMHHEHPELIRDQYWDEIFPTELPYTAAAEPFREEHPQPSTAGIQLSAAQQELQPSSVRIDEMAGEFQQKFRSDMADDAASGIHFTAGGKMSRLVSEQRYVTCMYVNALLGAIPISFMRSYLYCLDRSATESGKIARYIIVITYVFARLSRKCGNESSFAVGCHLFSAN